jgi:hypothetical protein
LPAHPANELRTGVRFSLFTKTGLPLGSWHFYGWPQDGDSAVFEFPVPRIPVSIEVLTRAFADPVSLDVEVHEPNAEPIEVKIP